MAILMCISLYMQVFINIYKMCLAVWVSLSIDVILIHICVCKHINNKKSEIGLAQPRISQGVALAGERLEGIRTLSPVATWKKP